MCAANSHLGALHPCRWCILWYSRLLPKPAVHSHPVHTAAGPHLPAKTVLRCAEIPDRRYQSDKNSLPLVRFVHRPAEQADGRSRCSVKGRCFPPTALEESKKPCLENQTQHWLARLLQLRLQCRPSKPLRLLPSIVSSEFLLMSHWYFYTSRKYLHYIPIQSKKQETPDWKP